MCHCNFLIFTATLLASYPIMQTLSIDHSARFALLIYNSARHSTIFTYTFRYTYMLVLMCSTILFYVIVSTKTYTRIPQQVETKVYYSVQILRVYVTVRIEKKKSRTRNILRRVNGTKKCVFFLSSLLPRDNDIPSMIASRARAKKKKSWPLYAWYMQEREKLQWFF